MESDGEMIVVVMLIFLLPAILYNGFSALPALLNNQNRINKFFLLFVPFAVGLYWNENQGFGEQGIFRMILVTSFSINCLCFIGFKQAFNKNTFKTLNS
ncbi:hypothetical protein FVR03_01800 [Pontibacter qinzhouensis]|uniref:Uncharacterized protein n=1 Tax=Pontibacter qinzhouensis TaxID=2603253 RepID=A0A5C8KE12_9BACT|nr:hypothetical protein [Pontibacter qinzhouensis]TXK52178.1 hypothetical protein FVR03_01800 [Pontibacter qinzhouensis]